MKNTVLFIAIISILLITLGLGRYFDAISQNEKLQTAQLYVYPLEKNFIEPEEVLKLMPIKDSLYKNVDIAELEQQLEKNDYISNAEVYKDLNGHLIAEVAQYHPIARVMGKTSYYIDINGDKKPLSKHFTERVVLVYGNITDKNKDQIIHLLKHIYQEEQLRKMIAEIHLKNDKLHLRINEIPALVVMNNNGNTEQQLKKLKAIYAYLIKNNQQNKYQQIDLRYKNQVVCR